MAESEITTRTTTSAKEGAIKNQLELKHHVRWHLQNIVKWQNKLVGKRGVGYTDMHIMKIECTYRQEMID